MVSFSLLGTLSTFLFGVLMTHLLSVYDYGILSKWLTDLSFIGVFFTMGLNISLMFFVRKNQSVQENIGKNIMIYSIILCIITFLIFFYADKTYYITLYVTIYTFSLNEVFRAYFQLEENFKLYNLFKPLRPFLVLIVFVLGILFKDSLTINASLIIYTLCAVISTIIIASFYLKNTYIKFNLSHIFKDLKYFSYGFKSILNTLLSLGLYSSCIYMLKWLSGYEGVAVFFVASSLSKMVWVLPDSAGNLLYPKFIKIKSHKEDSLAKKMMFDYAQIVFLLNLLALILFICFGELFINIVYSSEYQSAYYPIIILLIGNQGMVYYKLISRYLAAKNEWCPLYIALIVAIIATISLNYLLIPLYGITGAAISSCISFWACGLVISLFVPKSFIGFINILNPIKNLIKKHVFIK